MVTFLKPRWLMSVVKKPRKAIFVDRRRILMNIAKFSSTYENICFDLYEQMIVATIRPRQCFSHSA